MKNYVTISFVLLALALALTFHLYNETQHPFKDLNIVQLVEKCGYPIEIHEVTTPNGYILTLHRIPAGRHQNGTKNRKPVLVMHGMLQSAIDFVFLGPQKALGLILADLDYDVWLGNTRGTNWSRKHTEWNAETSKEYWNFDFEEMSVVDIPANINYILNKTGTNRLHYIGFSQGTAQFAVTLVKKPEYANKIRLMTALAPTLIARNISSPLLKLVTSNLGVKLTRFFAQTFNVSELMPSNGFMRNVITFFCNGNKLFTPLCITAMKFLQGRCAYTDEYDIPVIIRNIDSGVGTKMLLHCLQAGNAGELMSFDHGKEENLFIYGQENPPLYNFTKISVPVALYYSDSDDFIHKSNIPEVLKLLPNVIRAFKVPVPNFGHMEFTLSGIAHEIVYPVIIEDMSKY